MIGWVVTSAEYLDPAIANDHPQTFWEAPVRGRATPAIAISPVMLSLVLTIRRLSV